MKTKISFLTLLMASASLLAQYPANPPANSQNNQSPPQYDDQPGQPVARLSVINGDASVLRGDSGEWTAAVLNAPLMAGDSISVPQGSRVELQLDSANFLRADGNTEFRIAAFDAGRAQIQVSRGLVTWRALRDSRLQVEISTPVVAVHPMPLSAVRVEVASEGGSRVTVRRGEAEASTRQGTQRVPEGSMILAADGNGQVTYAAPSDGWDSWNEQRDGFLTRAQSTRWVSPDVYGAEDLDAAGRWGYDPEYGNVWTPEVPVNWAPYRDGRWVWSDYYGWTWVDAAPWGWAPYHYGSWYFRTGYGWSWFPGSRFGHHWYRPAMVSFFGFGTNIGWVPLAPFEVYRPWYGRGFRPGIGIGAGVSVLSFHNSGFATGVGIADFQRGAYGNHFGVNRGQLQQATAIHGPLPFSPTPASRQFAGRAPVVPANRGNFAQQGFYSRQNAGPGPAFGRPGGTAPPPASGWQRFGQTPSARPGPGSPAGASAGGQAWDRFGSAPRPGGPSGYQAPQPRSLQVAPPLMQQRPGPSGGRPSAPAARPAGGGGPGGGGPGGGGSSRGGAPRGGGGPNRGGHSERR